MKFETRRQWSFHTFRSFHPILRAQVINIVGFTAGFSPLPGSSPVLADHVVLVHAFVRWTFRTARLRERDAKHLGSKRIVHASAWNCRQRPLVT